MTPQLSASYDADGSQVIEYVKSEDNSNYVPIASVCVTTDAISTAVPEPASVALLSLGLLGIAGLRRCA